MRGRRAVSWPLLLLVLLLLWEKEGSVVHPLLSSCFVVSKSWNNPNLQFIH